MQTDAGGVGTPELTPPASVSGARPVDSPALEGRPGVPELGLPGRQACRQYQRGTWPGSVLL